MPRAPSPEADEQELSMNGSGRELSFLATESLPTREKKELSAQNKGPNNITKIFF